MTSFNPQIFYMLLCVFLGFVKAEFNPEQICSLVVDGTKLNDPRDCRDWIECIDGNPIAGSCDTGLFYDRQSKSCLPYDQVKCLSSSPCTGVPVKGFIADPYTCNGYYYCKVFKGTRGECNEGLNFNPGTDSCIRDFPCKSTMDPDSICNILPDGVFIKDPTNCNGWQMCWKGVVLSDVCSDTFFFDAAHGRCDYPQNVECEHTEPPPQKDDSEICPLANAFVSDAKSCSGYFYCRENSSGEMELLPGNCEKGRFFSGKNQGSCVPQEKLRCSYDRCDHLGFEHIELTSLTDDGCRGYAICQDGKTIETSTCPDDKYFDERTQRCTTEVITYAACVQSKDTTTP